MHANYRLRQVMALTSLLLWLLLQWLERLFAVHAGSRGIAPLIAVSILPLGLTVGSFLHSFFIAFLANGSACWKPLWRFCLALAAGAAFAYVVGLNHATKAELLDRFCCGVASAVSARAPAEAVIRDLKRVLEEVQDSEAPITVGAWALDAFTGHRPTLIRLPPNAKLPYSVEALWSFPGGAYGLHYGERPVNTPRFPGHNYHWTNSLWVIVRPE